MLISYIVLSQIEKSLIGKVQVKFSSKKNLNVKKEVTTKKKNGNDLLNAWSLLKGKITIRFNLFVQS